MRTDPLSAFEPSLKDKWAFDPDTGNLCDTEGTWLGVMTDATLAAHVVAMRNAALNEEVTL